MNHLHRITPREGTMNINTSSGRYSIVKLSEGRYSVRRVGFVDTLVGYFATLDAAVQAAQLDGVR